MNQYRIMKAPLVRPTKMMTMRPPLHPNSNTRHRASSQQQKQQQQKEAATTATTTTHPDDDDDLDLSDMITFLRVTLGFFPAYVNYTKRVSDQPDRKAAAAASASSTTSSPEEDNEEAEQNKEDDEDDNKTAVVLEQELLAAWSHEEERQQQSTNRATSSSPHPITDNVGNVSADGDDDDHDENNSSDCGGGTAGEDYAEIYCYHDNLPDVTELSDISDSETSTTTGGGTGTGTLEEFVDWYYTTVRSSSDNGDGDGGDNGQQEENKWNSDDETGISSYWSKDPEFVRLLDMIEREFSSWNIM